MIDVLERVAALVKGDATLDEALSQPFVFEPDVLYVWEENRAQTSIGTGEVRENFEVVAVYVSDGDGENAALRRSRDVTVKLDEWANAALDAIRLHANLGPWSHAQALTDADFLRQLAVRGAAIRVSGYRILD